MHGQHLARRRSLRQRSGCPFGVIHMAFPVQRFSQQLDRRLFLQAGTSQTVPFSPFAPEKGDVITAASSHERRQGVLEEILGFVALSRQQKELFGQIAKRLGILAG